MRRAGNKPAAAHHHRGSAARGNLASERFDRKLA